MHIVWLILKIIGIILAILLGVVIALILTVLLVPIRYRINGSKQESIEKEKEELKFQVLLSWFLRVILVKIEFQEELSYSIKIFGFTIKKNQAKEEQGFSNKNQTTEKKKRDKETKKREKKEKKKQDNLRVEYKKEEQEKQKQIQETLEQEKLEQKILKQEELGEEEQKQEKQILKQVLPEKEQIIKEQILEEEIKQESIQTSKETKREQESNNQIIQETQEVIKEETQKLIESKEKKKRSIIKKIKKFISNIFGLFDKIKRTIRKIGVNRKKAKNNIHRLLEKGKKILSFFREEQNKAGFGVLWNIAKLFLKHIKPTKLKLELQLGTGDPCSTGQVLGLLGVLYGCYGEGVQINPDFEHAILQGTIMVKGRIRLGSLLIIGIKLLLNKEIRTLWKTVQQLKEEL